MVADTAQALLARLADSEDQYVERKLEGAGATAFKRAMVSFANSVPASQSAVLFVGVEDDGGIRGVSNPDKLQKTLRKLSERDCYPPIFIDLSVLSVGDKVVVAAIVERSPRKPHFAGPAYVRRGSESVAATEEIYRDLLLSQDDKRAYLQEHRSVVWSVEFVGKKPGDSLPVRDSSFKASHECRIEEITAFYVRFCILGEGRMFTEMLADVHISYDDKQVRPKAVVWPEGR